MSQVQFEGTEKVTIKKVRFEGTDTLRAGYALCYNADFGTASEADADRAWRVEKPATGNLDNFAGVVAEKYDGKVGPVNIEILVPTKRGQKIKVWTDASVTVDSTQLYLTAGSFALTVSGGLQVAKAMQTVDRSSTNGTALALLTGSPVEAAKSGLAGGVGPSPLIWNDSLWNEVEADPSKGFRYWTDYLDTIDVTTADGYVITAATSGAIAPDVTEPGGVLLVDSAGNAVIDDGVNVQLTNCLFKPAAGTTIRFEARIKMLDTSASIGQFYVGLAGIDTTLIAAGVLDDVVDKAGFFRHAGSTADKMSSVTARTSAEDTTADVTTVADDTYINLGFVIDGLTSIKFYADGVLVETGTTTANIPNAVMALSYVSQVEQYSADTEMRIDWVRIIQEGSRAA